MIQHDEFEGTVLGWPVDVVIAPVYEGVRVTVRPSQRGCTKSVLVACFGMSEKHPTNAHAYAALRTAGFVKT